MTGGCAGPGNCLRVRQKRMRSPLSSIDSGSNEGDRVCGPACVSSQLPIVLRMTARQSHTEREGQDLHDVCHCDNFEWKQDHPGSSHQETRDQ